MDLDPASPASAGPWRSPTTCAAHRAFMAAETISTWPSSQVAESGIYATTN
jgi:hypothetical protein